MEPTRTPPTPTAPNGASSPSPTALVAGHTPHLAAKDTGTAPAAGGAQPARTPEAINEVLQVLGLAVLEAVEAAGPLGAPNGVLFAALQGMGASLNQYQSFMGGLTRRGFLVLDAQCYTLTDSGRAFKHKLADALVKRASLQTPAAVAPGGGAGTAAQPLHAS